LKSSNDSITTEGSPLRVMIIGSWSAQTRFYVPLAGFQGVASETVHPVPSGLKQDIP
jgi:hypothetical protein